MDKDIKDLVEKIRNATNKEEAIFIIQQYGGGSDESFAKANKEGLLLFAAEVLEAYLDKDEQLKNSKNSIGFEGPNELFGDGDTIIDYIEYTDAKRKSFDKDASQKFSLNERLKQIGFFLLVLIVSIIFIAGLYQVYNWL